MRIYSIRVYKYMPAARKIKLGSQATTKEEIAPLFARILKKAIV